MTTKTQLLQAIRKHCLECCGGSWLDVENCKSGPDANPYSQCGLWAFRFGRDPSPAPSKVEAGKRAMERLRDQSDPSVRSP